MRKWYLISGIIALTALSTTVLISDMKPILINRTASVPMGIYIRSFVPIQLGSIVSLPLPELMRPYVNSISPAWGKWLTTHPLLKQVVAMNGDTICRRGGVFTARGEVLARVAPERPGIPSSPAWNGCRRLERGEIAVFAGELADSIDSRQFGAVNASTARVYRPFLTWRNDARY